MYTKKICFSISCFLCGLGSFLFAIEDSNSVAKSYEERSKIFNLMFPEQKVAEAYNLRGLELLQKDKMPKHVCVSLEGNRRWARSRGMSLKEGYAESVKTTIKILKLEAMLGIKTVTLPCFSIPNVSSRQSEEMDPLLNLLGYYLKKDLDFIKPFVCIKTVGDLSRLPLDMQRDLEKLKEETASSIGFTLILAINYEGRDEVSRAVKKMAKDIEKGILQSEDVSVDLIESYLDSAGIPDVDLFVQTANDYSMFGAWRQFYTECFFLPMLGSDFNEQDFIDVLVEYQKLDRTFGS